MSLSRFGEEKYVYDTYFKKMNLSDGFFVELGAVDGLIVSNSYLLEDKYKFTGILIEPNPFEF